MKSETNYNSLNILVEQINLTPEQRVVEFYDMCFSTQMINNSSEKDLAGTISLMSMRLMVFLQENQLTYNELISSLELPEEQIRLLLDFEYDFSTIKPIGGPRKLSDKPTNKKLMSTYVTAFASICVALGGIGTFIQPIVDCLIHIEEKHQDLIENDIELDRIKEIKRTNDLKERELDSLDNESRTIDSSDEQQNDKKVEFY